MKKSKEKIIKESAKRTIELLLLGIWGVKETSDKTFKFHLQQVGKELDNLIDNL